MNLKITENVKVKTDKGEILLEKGKIRLRF